MVIIMAKRGIIEVDPRHTIRRMKTAMQGDAIRALAELTLNSDDSYIRLESSGIECSGLIIIGYEKDGYCGVFSVRDEAEGMCYDDVEKGFTKYGSATSGLKSGKPVRGYFGQGAKDALASMKDGKICTFKDNEYVECRIFIENMKPKYEIFEPITANPELRLIHKINHNGTVAYFKVDPSDGPKVPRFETVQRDLANNYLLRKIMMNPKRKVVLMDNETAKKRPLKYQNPVGNEILSDSFKINLPNYNEFLIYISIWRAEKGELNQKGDDREGGLLIVDDENIVLGISLFKYDNEPLAARFFGEIILGNFRELLINEEAVLSEDRTGLDPRHPFYHNLREEVEKRLEIKVKEEKLRKQKETKSKFDQEEFKRYRNAFSILNNIAEEESRTVVILNPGPIIEIAEGIILAPPYAKITVNKRYAFTLSVDTNVIPVGSTIKLHTSNTSIRVLQNEVVVDPKEESNIIKKYITVQCDEPNIIGTLYAQAINKKSEAKISVLPEKELLLSEGLVFQPESLTLRPGIPKKVYLLIYIKMIIGGTKINIESDNENIHISENTIIVDESKAEKHIVKCELEVWGEGVGQKAMITATCEDYEYIALLEVAIREKVKEPEGQKKGMFSEPEFNYDTDPNQRTSYSGETGKVIIYVNFPSTKHYLGDDCQYKKTLPAQVLIADLVGERCFHEIAKKKVEASGAAIRPESLPDYIQREAYDLSKKYGEKIHKLLVDQALVEEAKIHKI